MKWSDVVYLRLYFFSLSCVLKYNTSLANKSLIMLCNEFSAGERDASRAEEYFFNVLESLQKIPKTSLFYLKLRYGTGCWMSKSAVFIR